MPKAWNAARLRIANARGGIAKLEAEVRCLSDQMSDISHRLENILFNLDQPIGLKIDEDYVVVDTGSDSFVIQTVDFNLREELL